MRTEAGGDPSSCVLPGPDRDSASVVTACVGTHWAGGWHHRSESLLVPAPGLGSIFLWPRSPSCMGPQQGALPHPQCSEDTQPSPGVGMTANSTCSCPCRRGSPLLIGVRSKHKLSTEQIPILYRTRKSLPFGKAGCWCPSAGSPAP